MKLLLAVALITTSAAAPFRDGQLPICKKDPATGKWYNPEPQKSTQCRLPSTSPMTPPPPPADLIRILEASGEITLAPVAGWLPPENTAPRLPPLPDNVLDFDTVVQTGKDGKVTAQVDDHKVEIRNDTQVLIERIRRETGRVPSDLIIKVYKGAIRMKLIDLRYGQTCYLSGRWCRIRVVSPVGHFTPLGTDVEIHAASDLSGFIKLYEGAGTFQPFDTDREFTLQAGQMLAFDAQGRVTGPMPIR